MKRLFLSISSYYLTIVLLLMPIDFTNITPFAFLTIENATLRMVTKAVFLMSLGMVFALVLLKLITRNHSDNIEIRIIKPLESSVIPTYIGLFVIILNDLELNIKTTLILVLLFMLWTLFERNYYFNIFWAMWGYRFYEAEDINGNIITLISKTKDMKNTNKSRKIDNLARVNNFTFIEVTK
ncbi:MAG: hypothetical protein L0F95_05050 [Lactococcus sp.]|uniref:Putative membrane protein n=1 Tax=Pseudolactococcus piscium MKFS47 TaxID=297352 RepID=A0A0D6DWB5_9LACT|nr:MULTISPECIES: hypothetical protein [Lactobacillales]MBQ6483726.1 hypothetical protein [Carnobacterium sp.]MCJ1972162.1 hypothetical protein [Lactococcus carnosus]MDN5408874.1 hypothetical protein [Lactococcus sp.]MDN5411772.1 hypothetical protein [Lactococcus sp.]MDN5435962.1 hypothetical protein [Lactococcus sp.]